MGYTSQRNSSSQGQVRAGNTGIQAMEGKGRQAGVREYCQWVWGMVRGRAEIGRGRGQKGGRYSCVGGECSTGKYRQSTSGAQVLPATGPPPPPPCPSSKI